MHATKSHLVSRLSVLAKREERSETGCGAWTLGPLAPMGGRGA